MPTQLALFRYPAFSARLGILSCGEIADETQVLVPAETLQEEVALLFEKYDLTTAGVIDQDDKLLGMITVDDV